MINMKKHMGIVILISIILSCIVPYINSFHNPFIWDEEEIVVGNPIIKEWRYLPFIFKTDIFGSPIDPGGYYRPLYTLSFMLDYHLWGLNTFGYHLFSVIFHILNALLLYLFIRKIGLERKVAWVGSLLFSLFPVNCEAVTLIAARVELMLGLLTLLCFLLFLKGLKDSRFYLLGSVVAFMLSIFVKESALVLPFLMLTYVFIFLKKEERRKALSPLLIFIGIAVIYCGLRFLLLGNPSHRTLSLINEAGLIERFYTFPRILLTYIGLLVAPVVLKSEYHFVVHSIRDIYVWLGIPVLVLLFSLVYRFLKPRRHAVFFSCWFLLGLLPYYNLIFTLHSTLMEHWVYFSSMGFAVLMSMAVFNVIKRITLQKLRYVVIAMLILLMFCYAIRTIERNKDWRSPFLLYKTDVEREPNSFLLHCNLGVEYFRRGMMEEAKEEFKASIEKSPGSGYDMAYNNLGVMYAREGNDSKAIACYKKSIALDNCKLGYANLGGLYNKLGMHKEAALLLEEAARIYPLDAEIKYKLGVTYYELGEMKSAKETFEEIETLYGDYLDTRKFLELIGKTPEPI